MRDNTGNRERVQDGDQAQQRQPDNSSGRARKHSGKRPTMVRDIRATHSVSQISRTMVNASIFFRMISNLAEMPRAG